MQRKKRYSLSGSLISVSVSLLLPAVLHCPLDNLALLEAMFAAKVDDAVSSVGSFPRSERGSSQSFLRSSTTLAFKIYMFQQLLFKQLYAGVYSGDTTPTDQDCFLMERHCLHDLLACLNSACSCGMASNPWCLDSFVQVCVNLINKYLFLCNHW